MQLERSESSCEEYSIRLAADFSSAAIEARGRGVTYSKCWKEILLKRKTIAKLSINAWD